MMKRLIALLLVLLALPAAALSDREWSLADYVVYSSGRELGGYILADNSSVHAFGYCKADYQWTNMVKIVDVLGFQAGLTANGKVLLSSKNGQITAYKVTDACKWSGIVELYSNSALCYLYGIDKNGTLHVTSGDEWMKLSDGHHKANGWKNIKSIATTNGAIFGIQKDGKVKLGGAHTKRFAEAANWTNIQQIVCGQAKAYGLTTDGTVLYCGDDPATAVTAWTDIIQLSSYGAVAGLRADGTVVAANPDGYTYPATARWTNIREVHVSHDTIYGLSRSGTVHYANSNGKHGVLQWRNVVDIDNYNWPSSVFGLLADGTVVNFSGISVLPEHVPMGNAPALE